jgi:hypothetical protein
MYSFVTGRFTNETLAENYEYREINGIKCLYCCPLPLSPKIYYDTYVFVIEMNNTMNQIEGIGIIKNSHETKKYYRVHKDGNRNRYTYIGNFYISREMILRKNSCLVDILDQVLFKGYTHSKRGSGLLIFPEKVLSTITINVKQEIIDLFVYYFREKIDIK